MSLEQIKEYARRQSLKTVLVVIKDLNELDFLVNRYRFVFQCVILVKDRNGSYSLNSLRSLDLSNVLGFQVMNNLLSIWAQFSKRIMDVTVAILGLFILSPFFALAALLIKIDSGGSVFYHQHRIGRNGKIIDLIKFCTMYRNADKLLEKELARNPDLKAEWDHYQKLRRDPRITRVGGLLRKFSLDELPQLWNVLKGEMSLVGPRPFPAYHNARFDPEFRQVRVQVRPGLTGLWQVSARSDGDLEVQQSLDSYYIRNWSLWLDIYILFRTVRAVLAPRGSY